MRTSGRPKTQDEIFVLELDKNSLVKDHKTTLFDKNFNVILFEKAHILKFT